MSNSTDKSTLHLISADIAWKYKIIPQQLDETNKLTFLIDKEVFKPSLIGELEVVTGYQVQLIEQDSTVIESHLTRLYRKDLKKALSSSVSATNLDIGGDLLTKIILEAKELKSSDIHIEGYAEKCRIRLRIDGKLIERYNIPKEQYTAFINKIKIKAALDIAEKRLPQDGRILISDDTGKTEMRVSVLPSLYGEKIVLRILGSDASHISLENIGLDQKQMADYLQVLRKQQGIILISGPTGSGKTTTLYATLKQLNNEHSNILTIEDPIEYTLDGINQVQVRENIGLTFSSALRTFLRQDPDIIMLGEIRDPETANMAIRAALTGHLVLSTIHTNSAWGVISRLIDMGVPSFLLSNTLNLAAAQRLVRKLCVSCKSEMEFDPDESQITELSAITTHFTPTGCENCYYTGYSGRVAIYEIIPINEELSYLVKENATNVTSTLEKRKISTLKNSAISLVQKGITSIEEVYPILLNS